jgi:hypothetical protein
MLRSNLFVCTLFIALAYIPIVTSHGLMMHPLSRQALNVDNSCPQCSSAGGVGALSQHGGKHGLCGDPYGEPEPRANEAGGKFYRQGVFSTYAQAQVLDIEILTTTNHYGRFEFRVCNVRGGYDSAARLERDELTEECLDENILVQANVPGSQSPGERYFYATPGDPVVKRYKMHYQLPEELACDGETSHCVLQWHWLTLHNCRPDDWPAEYALNKDYQDCNVGIQTEEFWGCSDIRILPPAAGEVIDSTKLSTGEEVSPYWWHPSLSTYYDQE